MAHIATRLDEEENTHPLYLITHRPVLSFIWSDPNKARLR